MGRWFPDYRTGTPEQVRAFKDACRDLFRNSRYESNLRTADGRRAVREETVRYNDLNDRVNETERPLSRTQRSWHWHRALTEEDRDMGRLQRASGRQDRERRRAGRSR